MARRKEEGNNSTGISFLGLLAILFIGLKLTDHIDWSWWWVTAPLWGVPVSVIAVMFTVVAGAFLWFMADAGFKAITKKQRRSK